ncbi:MAG: ComF family protein [Lachnospiraceae bacterium]|nr:ComF family protein [Lachnospiraceae bacterium]
MFEKTLDLLFPRRCILCDEILQYGERGIHKKCKPMLFPVEEPVCMHCGRPVVSERAEYCFDCSRHKGTTFVQGKSLYVYRGQIKMTMYRFKYSNRREYGDYLAKELAERYGDWLMKKGIEAIAPVPMYRRKEKLRGYNQAAVLATKLRRELIKRQRRLQRQRLQPQPQHRRQHLSSQSQLPGIPALERNLVLRVRNTRPQKELNDIERKNNLKNAFQTREKVVKYKKILLIDDIYTTGSTADAVAEALYRAGVQQVFFLSVCIGQGM